MSKAIEKPNAEAVDLDRLVRYSPDEVKAAMIAADIRQVPHHDCGFCGCWVEYIREGDQLYFDPSCDCSWGNGPEPRNWEDASDWLNIQSSPDVQNKLAARFGLANEKAQATLPKNQPHQDQ